MTITIFSGKIKCKSKDDGMNASHDKQEELVPDVDFDLFTLPPVSLRDFVTDDEVFVSSPYQTTQCLPYFVQYNQVVQEIVRPHLRMNFKFRNKHFAIKKKSTGRLTEKRRPFVCIYLTRCYIY